jgi:hypothetical protein
LLAGLGLILWFAGCAAPGGPGPKAGIDILGTPARADNAVVPGNRLPVYRR